MTAGAMVSAVRRAARDARELAPDGVLTRQALDRFRRRDATTGPRSLAHDLTAAECEIVLATCCRPRLAGSRVESERTARRRGLVDGVGSVPFLMYY